MKPETFGFPMPPLPGLQFRFARGPEDAPGLGEIQENRIGPDGVDVDCNREEFYTPERIEQQLQQAQEKNQLALWPILEVAGRIVGFGNLEHWLEEDGTHVFLHTGFIDPAFRDQGLGSFLLHWLEETARVMANQQFPGEPFELAANASSTEVSSTRLLAENGYHAPYSVLAFRLDHPLSSPPPPLFPGVERITAKLENMEQIARSVKESYRDEYEGGRFDEKQGLEDYLEELLSLEKHWQYWQVATVGGKVVAQVLPVVHAPQAEIVEVSVLPSWRRKGIARSLLLRAIHLLQAQGVSDIRLFTLSTFPTRARDLYQQVGFSLQKEFPRYRKSPYSANATE